MGGRRAIVLALALSTLLGTSGLGLLPLVETSDARYAEIAREMVASGDLVTPRLDGLPHFHKPPLAYWASAAGQWLLGTNEWGARLGLLAAGILVLATLADFARRHAGPHAASLAVLVLATTPLFVGATRLLTADAFLLAGLVGALTGYHDAAAGAPARAPRLRLHLGLAVALLAKGPIALIVAAAVIVPCEVGRRRRGAGTRLGLPWGLPLTLSLAGGWLALVAVRHPGLLRYLVEDQLLGRLGARGEGHARGPLYYLGTWPALCLPWIVFLPGAARAAWRDDLGRFLLLWTLLPPVLFSIPATKLPLYVLPSAPSLALLVGRHLAATESRSELPWRLAALVLAGVGAASVALAAGRVTLRAGDLADLDAPGTRTLLAALGGASLLGGLVVLLGRSWRPAALVASLVASLAIAGLGGRHLPVRTVAPVAEAARRLSEGGVRIVEDRSFSSGLPFYLGHPVPLAALRREDRFGLPGTEATLVLTPETFFEAWRGPGRMAVLTRETHLGDLGAVRVVARGGGYVLVEARRE